MAPVMEEQPPGDVLGSLFEVELFGIVENKINQCARLFPCNPPS